MLHDPVCTQEQAALLLGGPSATHATALTLAGLAGWARIVDVYDGDTCTAVMAVPGLGFRRLKLRLQGVDCPEIKGGTLQEKEAAVRARDFLVEFLKVPGDDDTPRGLSRAELAARLMKEPALAWVTCGGFDKYGRVLAELRSFPGGPAASEVLVRAGHAVAYDGGTKSPFEAADPASRNS